MTNDDRVILFERWRGLIHAVIKRFYSRRISQIPSIDRDDIEVAAQFALWRATADYDPVRGPFPSFAYFRIRGAIRDQFRELGNVPRVAYARKKAFNRARNRLEQKTGHAVTLHDIASELGVSPSEAERWLQSWERVKSETALQNLVSSGPIEHDAARDAIRNALDKMKPTWREIIVRYFWHNETHEQIAAAMGYASGPSAIGNPKKRALAFLKKELLKAGVYVGNRSARVKHQRTGYNSKRGVNVGDDALRYRRWRARLRADGKKPTPKSRRVS